ncbi:dihydroorotate dehydrogenase electron transfer subunit [Alkalibacterium sp.]|nr:MAG: dihydroorotate dehydrogenase electron transfer subunit [Alkalibacterium sp.]
MKLMNTHLHAISVIAEKTIKMDIVIEKKLLETIRPGQFVYIQIGSSSEHMLRRPISIADVDIEKELLTLVYKELGEGTRKLSQLKKGDPLNLLIPCGNGYRIDQLQLSHALLIGGGIGVPPLYYLAKKLVEKGIKVTTIIGFQSKEDVFFEEEFKGLGDCFVTTNDGSYGQQGYVTDSIEKEQPEFDNYFACGPNPMLKAIELKLTDKKGFLSLEERMGCGIGACYACVVPTKDEKGSKKICQDGPVFSAGEVKI